MRPETNAAIDADVMRALIQVEMRLFIPLSSCLSNFCCLIDFKK